MSSDFLHIIENRITICEDCFQDYDKCQNKPDSMHPDSKRGFYEENSRHLKRGDEIKGGIPGNDAN